MKRLRVVLLIELVRVHRRWPSRKTLCPTGKVDQRGQEQGKEEGRIPLTILVPEEEEREELPPSYDPWCSYLTGVCHKFGPEKWGRASLCRRNDRQILHFGQPR